MLKNEVGLLCLAAAVTQAVIQNDRIIPIEEKKLQQSLCATGVMS